MSVRREPPPVEWAGLAAWIAARYPEVATVGAAALAARLAGASPPLLVDVRSPDEQAVSTLPAALCVTPDADVAALAVAAEGRDVVVYCAVGVRSARLARALGAAGVSTASLAGGIFAWANAGLPLAGPGAAQGVVHGYDATWEALLDPMHRASRPVASG